MRRLATLLTLVLLGLSCSGSGKNSREKATPTIRPVESNTQRNISGVWVDSQGTLWVATPPPVGERNSVQSFADGTWTDRGRGFPPGRGVGEFWGNSSGVLIGYNWDQVWRYVDGDWTRILDDEGNIDPIGVSGSEDGTIVVVCGYYQRLYHFHVDRANEAERGGWDLALGDVWVFDKDYFITVPTRRGGTTPGRSSPDGVQELPLPKEARQKGIRGIWSPDNKELLAVGHKGLIVRLVGDEWTLEETPTDKALHSVWGDRKDRSVAVGDDGTILLYDGTSWTLLPSGTTAQLNSVRGGRNGRIFIGGNGGTLLELVWP